MMSPPDDNALSTVDDDVETEETPEKLDLQIKIDSPSVCQRHFTVTVSRDDLDRYFDKAFSELVTTASVPGFRPGRAPRKLIEQRFRSDVVDQVKSNVLMDSIAQVTDDEDLSAISEPDFDFEAVAVPEEGPMTFEFDLEVRPDFDLPEWKGLALERPVREFDSKDTDTHLEKILGRLGKLVPLEGAADVGDYVVVNLVFKDGDQVLSSGEEETIRIKPVLSFRDGKIEAFDELLKGVKAGETREGKAELSTDAPNAALRGKVITASFEVLDVKRLELPELTPQVLSDLGDFESEAELRDAIGDNLHRQLSYHRQQRIREQITTRLTAAADWDLPPEMLRRQSSRELDRAVLELRRSGFSEEDIRTHENDIRQNSTSRTARALKEHFILERIAENEEIEVDSEDYDLEIAMIANQSGESARRVRARLEKQGTMDALRNQIIERKVIEQIEQHAKFTDVPFEMEPSNVEAIEQAAGGGTETEIPEAKHGGEAQSLPEPKDRT